MKKKKKSKAPYGYELWINGEIIFGDSPKYLRNVAIMKGGDWAIYACFKSGYVNTANMKLNLDQMRKAKIMRNQGLLLKDIGYRLGVTEYCISNIFKKNTWL